LTAKVLEVIWCLVLIIVIGAGGGPVVVVCCYVGAGGVGTEETAAAEEFSEERAEGGDIAYEETYAGLEAGPDCEAGGYSWYMLVMECLVKEDVTDQRSQTVLPRLRL
jgi:hypothetical protein